MAAVGIIIIGAGEAGTRAAISLRQAGYDGPVRLIGEERHAPYERPPLSKAVIVERDSAWLPAIADASALEETKVERLGGACVTGIDRSAHRIALADGRAFSYDRLLLATGAAPRRLTLADDGRVLYLRSFDDAVALRERFRAGHHIAIIGGGFIGLELASSARAKGCMVTLIEAAPRILMRGVPEPIAQFVKARHETEGVAFHIGTAIAAIRNQEGKSIVTLADGTAIAADCIVAGIGAIPNVNLARQAGLSIENGIAVDGRLRTSDPDIFAAGDCVSFPHPLYDGRRIRLESWRNAFDQGAFVAQSLLGAGDSFAAPPWFWSDQYDITLQIAGLVDEGKTSVSRDIGEDARLMFHLAEDGRLVAASAIGPMGKVARDIRLAEMLIARRAYPDQAALTSSSTKLKSLLAA